LAEKEYAVDVDSVREVRRIKTIIPIPKTLDFVEGVVSLRGNVIPIINLRKKLGLPGLQKSNLNRVLMVELNDHIIGIAVDNVIGVVSVDGLNIESPDELLKDAAYLKGVAKSGHRLILIIDIMSLLSGEETLGISDIHKKVEIRKKA